MIAGNWLARNMYYPDDFEAHKNLSHKQFTISVCYFIDGAAINLKFPIKHEWIFARIRKAGVHSTKSLWKSLSIGKLINALIFFVGKHVLSIAVQVWLLDISDSRYSPLVRSKPISSIFFISSRHCWFQSFIPIKIT